MNKTLLLILVDFLLLTILSLTEWTDEAEPKGNAVDEAASRQSVAAMAMMEQDLLDALQFSLEEQREAQEELAASLSETESELQQRESRIQNLESNLTEAQAREAELQRARAALESTKQQIESQARDLEQEVQQASARLEETELAARESEAQSRLLQEELQKRLAEIAAKEQALAAASQKIEESQSRIQELDVAVKMSEQERSFLRESVSTLKSEIVSEREERQRVQAQAGELAQGVTKLAETSNDIRQELRSSIPINANQLFAAYQSNQVLARYDSLKQIRDRVAQGADETSTILVAEGDSVYALTHIDSGPFGIKTNPGSVRALRLALERDGERVSADSMRFLDADPRVVLVPLTPAQVERLGSLPYLIAPEDPFKFSEAVLVNSRGDYYGEVEFKLDAATPGYVRMQSRIFSALFGEFSPSTGDLVLSKTGELLGVMVNRRYCVLITNLANRRGIEVGGEIDAARFRETLESLDDTVGSFPRELR